MKDQNISTTKSKYTILYVMFGLLALVISITFLFALAASAASVTKTIFALLGIVAVVITAYFGLRSALNTP